MKRMSLLLVLAFLGACAGDSPRVLAINLSSGEQQSFASEGDVPDGWVVCADSVCPPIGPCEGLSEVDCVARVDCDAVTEHPASTPSRGFVGCVMVGQCITESCGPAALAPSYVCSDGSLGGNTGRCIPVTGGGCGWEFREFRECPPDECTPRECGPAPGGILFCDDGSQARDVICERLAGGGCGWVPQCPATCELEDCGPASLAPAYMCADGSIGGNTGRCIPTELGCGWEHRECPAPMCNDEDCAIRPGSAPRCGDGSTANTVCAPSPAGTCGWEFQCPGTP